MPKEALPENHAIGIALALLIVLLDAGIALPVYAGPTVSSETLGCSAIVADLPPYLMGTDLARNRSADQTFKVTRRIPHDPKAYTQGLAYNRGSLYESTGLRGHSSIRKIELETGRVVSRKRIDDQWFAEGITLLNGQLLQVTWHAQTALLYDTNLKSVGTLKYKGDAWGLANLNGRMVVSDGSSELKFLEAGTFRSLAKLTVTDHGQAVAGLNELETVEGFIYANVYPTDCIAQIDPFSGSVVSWINLSGLLPLSKRGNRSAVANGIAYDSDRGKLFVTGKLWPYIFELEIPAIKNN